MFAPFVLAAMQVSIGPYDRNFERYIKSCQSDFERGLVETQEMLRTHKLPPPHQQFWSNLPVTEQPSAQVVCAAWLEGMSYELGKTKLVVARPK